MERHIKLSQGRDATFCVSEIRQTEKKKIVSRKARKDAKFRKKNKEIHTSEKENCIDIQDEEDGRSDTEKLLEIRSYKFADGGLSGKSEQLLFCILDKSSTHFPWKRNNTTLSPDKNNSPSQGAEKNSPPLEGWQAKPDGVVKRAVQTPLKIKHRKRNINIDLQDKEDGISDKDFLKRVCFSLLVAPALVLA